MTSRSKLQARVCIVGGGGGGGGGGGVGVGGVWGGNVIENN